MPTISVAIIAKDEEEVIARCLQSAGRFADEIVLVDTGSMDRTMEIARQHTPHVHASEHFTKDTHYSDFEFGVAKNEAIRRCTGDWIVWVDADDFFPPSMAAKVRQLAKTAKPDALYGFVVSFGGSRFEHTRMFPNGKNILFDETHACHEYLLARGLAVRKCPDIVIEHLPGKKPVPSHVRNLAILEKDYYQRGRTDARTLFYLGNAYRENDKKKKAVECYDQYLTKSEWTEERLFARIYRAMCLPPKEALREYYRALTEDDRYAETYCGIGDILFNMKQYRLARAWYETARVLSVPDDARLFVMPSKYSSYPKARINECREMLGGTDERFSFPVDEIKAVQVMHRDRCQERRNERAMLETDKQVVATHVQLPDSRSGALLATQAVLACARRGPVNVLTDDADMARFYEGLPGVLLVNQPVGDAHTVQLSMPTTMNGEHASVWFAKLLDVEIDHTLPVLPDHQPDTRLLTQAMRLGDFVVLQAAADDSVDQWPKHRWALVVQHLAARKIHVVQIDDFQHKVAGAMLLGNSLGTARMLISMCSAFVGCYGWGTHVAAALSKPSTVLWGGTPVGLFGYSHHNNLSRWMRCQSSCRDCQPCGRMVCMESLSVRTVLRHLEAQNAAPVAV